MPFGGQTITFVDIDLTGDAGGDEMGEREPVETTTPAPGCRHRPLTFKESAELEFNVATEVWRSTIPVCEYDAVLREKVLSAKSTDVIEVDGKRYRIIGGIRHHPDMDGNPFKVTIISERTYG